DKSKYVATVTNTPATIIMMVSIYSTSLLILKIMVTTTPTTVRATPVSKIVTVVSSIVPYRGIWICINDCCKKGCPSMVTPLPDNNTMMTPNAATCWKSKGMPFCTVSISKANNNKTNAEASTKPAINPPPG